MSSAYRSAYHHLVGSRIEQVEALQAHAEPWRPKLRAIHAARMARILAGAVGVSGAVSMAFVSAFTSDGLPTFAMLTAAILMVVVYAATRAAFRIAEVGRPAKPFVTPELSGQLEADLATLETENGVARIVRRLAKLEGLAMDLPLIAISLLAPLTLHFCFVSTFGEYDPRAFARWIRISLVVVGHAHLALAILACRSARKLRRTAPEDLAATSIHREWGATLGMVVGASALPGVLLFVVPPVLSALTGIVFIPLMYVLTAWRLREERAVIAAATTRDEVAPPPRVEVLYLREEQATDLAEDAALERAV